MHKYPSTALTLTSSLQATKIDFCQGQHKEITASKKQTVNLHRTDLLPKLTMP